MIFLRYDFLAYNKTSETIKVSNENEILWKKDLIDRNDQVSSIDKWLQTVSSICTEYVDPLTSSESVITNSLSVSKIEHFDIAPILCPDVNNVFCLFRCF